MDYDHLDVSLRVDSEERNPDVLRAEMSVLTTQTSEMFAADAYAAVQNVQAQCAVDVKNICSANSIALQNRIIDDQMMSRRLTAEPSGGMELIKAIQSLYRHNSDNLVNPSVIPRFLKAKKDKESKVEKTVKDASAAPAMNLPSVAAAPKSGMKSLKLSPGPVIKKLDNGENDDTPKRNGPGNMAGRGAGRGGFGGRGGRGMGSRGRGDGSSDVGLAAQEITDAAVAAESAGGSNGAGRGGRGGGMAGLLNGRGGVMGRFGGRGNGPQLTPKQQQELQKQQANLAQGPNGGVAGAIKSIFTPNGAANARPLPPNADGRPATPARMRPVTVAAGAGAAPNSAEPSASASAGRIHHHHSTVPVPVETVAAATDAAAPPAAVDAKSNPFLAKAGAAPVKSVEPVTAAAPTATAKDSKAAVAAPAVAAPAVAAPAAAAPAVAKDSKSTTKAVPVAAKDAKAAAPVDAAAAAAPVKASKDSKKDSKKESTTAAAKEEVKEVKGAAAAGAPAGTAVVPLPAHEHHKAAAAPAEAVTAPAAASAPKAAASAPKAAAPAPAAAKDAKTIAASPAAAKGKSVAVPAPPAPPAALTAVAPAVATSKDAKPAANDAATAPAAIAAAVDADANVAVRPAAEQGGPRLRGGHKRPNGGGATVAPSNRRRTMQWKSVQDHHDHDHNESDSDSEGEGDRRRPPPPPREGAPKPRPGCGPHRHLTREGAAAHAMLSMPHPHEHGRRDEHGPHNDDWGVKAPCEEQEDGEKGWWGRSPSPPPPPEEQQDLLYSGALGYGPSADLCMYQHYEELSAPCSEAIDALYQVRQEYREAAQVPPPHHCHGGLILIGLVLLACGVRRWMMRGRIQKMRTFMDAIRGNEALKATIEKETGLSVPEPPCHRAGNCKKSWKCKLAMALALLVSLIVAVDVSGHILQHMDERAMEEGVPPASPAKAVGIILLVLAVEWLSLLVLVKLGKFVKTRFFSGSSLGVTVEPSAPIFTHGDGYAPLPQGDEGTEMTTLPGRPVVIAPSNTITTTKMVLPNGSVVMVPVSAAPVTSVRMV